MFILLRCFSSDVVNKNGLHSWHAALSVSSSVTGQSQTFHEKVSIPEKNPLCMLLDPMQLLRRWWGYNLWCQRKICDCPWEKIMDSRKMGWMSRGCFRDKCLYDALPLQTRKSCNCFFNIWFVMVCGICLVRTVHTVLFIPLTFVLCCLLGAECTSLQWFTKC